VPALRLAAYGAGVVGVVVVTRVLWQFVVPPVLYRLRDKAGVDPRVSSPAERLVLGWTGMRGAISLAAALALPLEAGGRPFPGRALLVFLTVVVVLATLVAQGLTLPLLLDRLGLAGHGDRARDSAEQEARLALADIALARLDELEGSGEVSSAGVRPLRDVWEQERTRATPDSSIEDEDVDLTWLRLELTRAQGEELDRRRREGRVPAEVARTLRQELDLQQVRLAGTQQ
jgi:NhaP-type Na+/H+ or K+/H+ antiporter